MEKDFYTRWGIVKEFGYNNPSKPYNGVVPLLGDSGRERAKEPEQKPFVPYTSKLMADRAKAVEKSRANAERRLKCQKISI